MVGFWNEFWTALRTPKRLLLWLLLSALVAAIGPLATWAIDNPLLRFAYWATVLMAGMSIALASRALLRRMVPDLPKIWRSLGVAGVVGLILTPVTLQVTAPLIRSDYVGIRPNWTLFFVIAAVPLLIDLIRYFIGDQGAGDLQPGSAPQYARLIQRLPADCQGKVLHLAGRDHHVDVRTDKGVCRIRLRLRDAIAELDQTEGLCVHRSHWVAVDAVVGREWDKRRPVLVLSDGTRVPVSQKYEPDVVARKLV